MSLLLDFEFRVAVALYGKNLRMLVDATLTNAEDIEIVMGPLADKEYIQKIYDTIRESKSSLTIESMADALAEVLPALESTHGNLPPFHTVLIAGMTIHKPDYFFQNGIASLSNIIIFSNHTVVHRSFSPRSKMRELIIEKGAANLTDFEESTVAWNVETEAGFCAPDPEKLAYFGYEAFYNSSIQLKRDRRDLITAKKRWIPTMQLFGEVATPKYKKPNSPRLYHSLVLPSDFPHLRAGSHSSSVDLNYRKMNGDILISLGVLTEKGKGKDYYVKKIKQRAKIYTGHKWESLELLFNDRTHIKDPTFIFRRKHSNIMGKVSFFPRNIQV